jgi:peroxiredoxin
MNRNKMILGTMVIVIIATVSLLSLGNKDVDNKSIHTASHKAGLCSGESCATNGVAANAADNTSCAPGSASCDTPGQAVTASELSLDEKKIVDYITNQIVSENRFQFEDEEIEKATAVSVKTFNESRLQAAVMAELSRRNVNLGSIACAGNCATFSACSIDRNLNGASGKELARYQVEKAEDGKTYSNLSAPAFTLPMTDGSKVSLADYNGKPLAIVTLSVHCYHSMETLPILAKLKKKYEAQDLEILPVFVNANSVEDIQATIEGFDLDFPVGVAEGKALSESYNSRMVPSTFLIDSQGNITKKLVGQKDEATLDQAFSELIEASDLVLSLSKR